MIEDIVKRPFITVGHGDVSDPASRWRSRRIASRSGGWAGAGRRLHRLVYVAGILAVIHFWWLVKADITLPRRWAVAVGVVAAVPHMVGERGRRLSLRS